MTRDDTQDRTRIRWRERAGEFAADFASFPGWNEIWNEDRPSLATIRDYSDHGKYAPQAGAFRTAGRVYNRLYATPQVARLRWREWIAERPAREFVYRACWVTFMFTPWGGAVMGGASRVFGWLSTLHNLI